MPLTLKKAFTEEQAAKLAKPVLLPDGTYPAEIRGAHDTKAQKSRRDMIRATAAVLDAEGTEHEIPIFLHTAPAALLLLLRTARAVGAEAKLSAGSISAEDIKGPVRVVIGTEKARKGFSARNVILDVLPAETPNVVPLRAAE